MTKAKAIAQSTPRKLEWRFLYQYQDGNHPPRIRLQCDVTSDYHFTCYIDAKLKMNFVAYNSNEYGSQFDHDAVLTSKELTTLIKKAEGIAKKHFGV